MTTSKAATDKSFVAANANVQFDSKNIRVQTARTVVAIFYQVGTDAHTSL